MEILQAATDEKARILEFYKTISGLSFALLGLWWVALELRYKDWEESPQARRHAYGVMLFFLFPGLMSLFSLIDDASAWWRLVFGLTALLGMGEIGLYYSAPRNQMRSADILRVIGLIDYALVLIVAFRPLVVRDLGIGLSGLQVEAVLTGVLIVIGVHLAFLAMTEHAPTSS